MARYGMLVDTRRCAGCYACAVACQLWNNQRPGTAWSHVERREWTDENGESRRAYLPHACMHCTDAPCEQVCPTGATYTRDDGIVAINYEACIGCGANSLSWSSSSRLPLATATPQYSGSWKGMKTAAVVSGLAWLLR